MPDVAELQVVVTADTKPAETQLTGFGSSMGKALGVGAAAAGAAVAAGLAVGVKAAGDLEQSVANISTIKPDIDTSAVFASLNQLSTQVPQSSKQLGDALYNVFSSIDVSTEQAMHLVETFAKGAVGAQTDAETFGTSILGVLNAYGLAAEDANHVSDVFFNTVNKGVVTGQELASSLGPVTQAAKSAGVSIDELGGLIAAVTKEGGPAAQNINNLNNFLQKITTKEAQKQLNDLGVATKDATGSFRPTADVLTDLKARLAGMTEAARANALQAIFPDAQARQGAATLLSQLDLVKSATDDNRTSAGSAEAAYAKMSATFNSQSQLLMNSLTSILTTIGAQVLPVITPFIKAFADSLPGAFAATQATLAPLGKALDPLFRTISDGWTTVQQVFSNDWEPSDQIDPFVNALGIVVTVIRDDVVPAVKTVAAFIIQQFGVVVSWVQDNLPLIQKTVQTVFGAIQAFWQQHGDTIVKIIQAAWTVVSTTIGNGIRTILDVIKLGMQLITGDWSGAWDTVQDIARTQWDTISTVIGTALDLIYTLIDQQTGGALTTITTWLKDAITAVTTTWTDITTAISDAWTAINDTTTTLSRAFQNIIDAVFKLIYDTIIKPQMDAISNYISTTWDAISTAVHGVLDPLLAYIRDTIFEPIRSAVEEKINAAHTLFETAVKAISDTAHSILDPLLTWWSSTIWEPIRAAVDTAMYGPKGAHTQFDSAVQGMSDLANGTLQAVKTTWENVWTAIKTAAESPQQALNLIIELVDKLKRVMPDWLIPHSPTPFQIGLEGIMKAAKDMDGAFRGMGGAVSGAVDDWLKAAIRYTGVSPDWLDDLRWIVAHESSGDPRAKNPNSTASGLFQIIDTTWAGSRDPKLPNDIFNPIINAIGGIRYILERYGTAANAVDYWKKHGHYAEGGWAGLHGPEMAWLGERGPEYVIPNAALRHGGAGLLERHEIAITIGGREAERIYVTGRDLAVRRGRN